MTGAPRLTATYRLQMNAGFTFVQARERLDYFAALGVSHLYLSPILAARRGSMHGYDVVDPTRLNPELGDEAALRDLSRAALSRDMGLIVDIVPNHMGIGAENAFWDDVLTHGERSRFARWFDIDWTPRGGHRKLLLPVLGDDFDRVVDRGELTVGLVEGETPRIRYFAHSFPIDPASLPGDLQLAQLDPEEAGSLADAYAGEAGRERLHELLDAQHYRLVNWRRGPNEINYRRFFDVDHLAAVRVEDEAVFDETHAYMLKLVREGVVHGLRIDHIDGLYDPKAYLTRLRRATPPGLPIFVEKILSGDEELDRAWPVDGTTGYEFLNDLGDVFIDPLGFVEIETGYRRMRRLENTRFADIAREGKIDMLAGPLRTDVERLVALLAPVAHAAHHRWSGEELGGAIIDFVAALPVYRTYVDASGDVGADVRALIERTAADAARASRWPEIVHFVGGVITGTAPGVDPKARLRFVQRLQQVSGPATAKGVEDTALYAYIPLASRNEVGGAPDRPLDDAVAHLHLRNARRAEYWPTSLVATNTHDTKRSADVRARLEALSEIPAEWERSIRRWRRLNDRHRETVDGRMAPTTNSEYLLYQTLVALWPPPRVGRRSDDIPDRAWRDAARTRLTQYMIKAGREAKLRTTWTDPDSPYEEAVKRFVAAVLLPSDEAPFLSDVSRLVSRLSGSAAWNALARVTIHLTAPGTPDLYQGDDLWNFSLVDPDNRRQVDYDARACALAELPVIADRVTRGDPVDPYDGRIKLLVTHRLLTMRRAHPDLFAGGGYVPLSVRGARAAHVVAFARTGGGEESVTIVPRLVASLDATHAAAWWADTAVELPASAPASQDRPWRSQLLSDVTLPPERLLPVAQVLDKLPVAVLLR